jgi:hypothetical protein
VTHGWGWKKHVFILYYRQYIHYLTSKSERVSAPFCLCNVSSKCPTIVSQYTGTPLALAPLFSAGNILVKSLTVLIANCTELCMIVQDQQPYHDSFLRYDFPENWWWYFWMISVLLILLHSAGLQILRPVLNILFEVQQIYSLWS